MSSLKTIQKYQLFINGEWLNPTSEKYFDVINPTTSKVVSKAAFGSEREVKRAIETSYIAFSKWSTTPASERYSILLRLYQLMLDNSASLAQTISLEMGKPLKYALAEVKSAAEYVLWNAEEGKRVYGENIPSSSKNKRLQVIRQPVGPVAAITPWNFPLSMVTRKISPALAAGCTVVLKPAEQTPGSAVQFFKLAEEAGVPKGVINLVMGNPSEIGDIFLKDPRIKKITFTGSTEVGKQLLKKAADQVKRVSMELGGNAPFIVFDDADLELAVSSIVRAKFFNSGQTCICPNRIYIQKKIKDSFLKLFKEKVIKLNVGNGLDESVEVGPVVNEKSLSKIKKQVEDAKSKGATVITGGEECLVPNYENGYFYSPTILTNVNEEMLITNEETFGPVAALIDFESEEQVITKANNTNYGLAAYFFTKDLSRSVRVSESLEYGMIGVNDSQLAQVQIPFGGVKESGLGREGGPDGLTDFLETKLISTLF